MNIWHPYLWKAFKNRTNKKINTGEEEQSKKWITFTFLGKETRRIAEIYKNTNIRIAFKTNNTTKSLHIRAEKSGIDRYNNSDIYPLKVSRL
jgi:hypothetical protein